MEHATQLYEDVIQGYEKSKCYPNIIDENKYRYVGWYSQNNNNPCFKSYFTPYNVRMISEKCTQLLQGVDKKGRDIIIPDNIIAHVMSQIFENRTFKIGDIHSRYIVPDASQEDYVQTMINRTIEVIVSDVKNNLGMDQWNESLSIWDATLMGDFNRKGLRQHPPIKLREKRPMPMYFFENY